jgi:hypothetical protein
VANRRRKPKRIRHYVSVSAEAYRLIKLAAETRKMSMRQVVEEACK